MCKLMQVGTGVEFKAPSNTIYVVLGVLFTANHLTDTDKQNSTGNTGNKYNSKQESCAIAKTTAHSGSNEPLWRYGHSKLSKMAACHQLGFDVTGNSAIQSADSENATLEPNMKCIGSLAAEIWPFAYVGGIWNPILGNGRS